MSGQKFRSCCAVGQYNGEGSEEEGTGTCVMTHNLSRHSKNVVFRLLKCEVLMTRSRVGIAHNGKDLTSFSSNDIYSECCGGRYDSFSTIARLQCCMKF